MRYFLRLMSPQSFARSIFAIVILSSLSAAAAEAPRVVITIKPLHSLAVGIMAGAGEPTLLLEGNQSPHTFNLRPSQAAALETADLVVWVGPIMEPGLAKAINSLAGDARHLRLSVLPDIGLMEIREGGVWEAHIEEEPDQEILGEEAENDALGDNNMHIWLDPIRMKVYVAALVDELAMIDPAHAALYRDNGHRIASELDSLDAELANLLTSVKSKPFVVFHDAYRYFETRYGLAAAGSISLTPERAPGPKRINEIREAIVERGVVCVFAEPQFPAPIVDTAIEGTPAKRGTLDPIGLNLEPGPEAYGALMRNLAGNLADCLGGN